MVLNTDTSATRSMISMPEKRLTCVNFFVVILSTLDFDCKRIRLGLGKFSYNNLLVIVYIQDVWIQKQYCDLMNLELFG